MPRGPVNHLGCTTPHGSVGPRFEGLARDVQGNTNHYIASRGAYGKRSGVTFPSVLAASRTAGGEDVTARDGNGPLGQVGGKHTWHPRIAYRYYPVKTYEPYYLNTGNG